MIKENGSIVTECVMSENIQKKFSHKLYIASVIALIIGSLGLAAYIVVSVCYEIQFEYTPEWCEALLLFAIPFGFGLVFLITLRMQVKSARRISGIKNVYEFYSDCIIAREIRDGAQTGVVRFRYEDIVKTKDDSGMLYFYYQVKTLAYPIEKSTLTAEELNTVKKLLKMPLDAGAPVVELSPCTDWGQNLQI